MRPAPCAALFLMLAASPAWPQGPASAATPADATPAGAGPAGAGPVGAAPAGAAPAGPPHAWLFGSWTGGLFPAAASDEPAACHGSPTLIVTRDVVLRAQLVSPSYGQRLIVSVRASSGAAVVRFAPSPTAVESDAAGLLGLPDPRAEPGFGCDGGPDTLVVQRISGDTIAFPGCRDFPHPLQRCREP